MQPWCAACNNFFRVKPIDLTSGISFLFLSAQQTTKQELSAESREFVKPIKISPLGLHEDDLLYGSDQLQNGNPEPVQLRHHSGHFRHKTANIWDPHPMYEFTAFQKKFHLVLEHDSNFASPDLQVKYIITPRIFLWTGYEISSTMNYYYYCYFIRRDKNYNDIVRKFSFSIL